MASYQGHLTTSTVLGAAYGAAAVWYFHVDWGAAFLGAGLTALGGLLPDIDSDSGKPVRELFGILSAAVPLMLFRRLARIGLSVEQIIVVLAGVHLFIRYPLAGLFKRLTVHRGMFHSMPAMIIAGLVIYLAHHGDDFLRIYLAVGVMIGFLSHLVLDEICAVDLSGGRVSLNQFAGTAVKLFSPSWKATVFTYAVLAGLGWVAWVDRVPPASGARNEPLFPAQPASQPASEKGTTFFQKIRGAVAK